MTIQLLNHRSCALKSPSCTCASEPKKTRATEIASVQTVTRTDVRTFHPRQRFTFSTVPPVALGKILTVTSAFAPSFSGTENFACCIGPGATALQPSGTLPGSAAGSGGGAGTSDVQAVNFTVFRNSKNAG